MVSLSSVRFALVSVVLTLAVNWLIAYVRAAKAIYVDQQKEIENLKAQLNARSKFDDDAAKILKQRVWGLASVSQSVLAAILRRGQTDIYGITGSCDLTMEAAQNAISELIYADLIDVDRSGSRSQYTVPASTRDTLKGVMSAL